MSTDTSNNDSDVNFHETTLLEETESENSPVKFFSLTSPIINTFTALKNVLYSASDIDKITSLTTEFQVNPKESSSLCSITTTTTTNNNNKQSSNVANSDEIKNTDNKLHADTKPIDSKNSINGKFSSQMNYHHKDIISQTNSKVDSIDVPSSKCDVPNSSYFSASPTRSPKNDRQSPKVTTRPLDLPPKNRNEEERHVREYEEMRRLHEKKQNEKKILKEKRRLEREKRILEDSKKWTKQILPEWNKMKNNPKVRELWWHGVPTHLRGKVWQLAIGNSLHITKEMYEILVQKAQTLKQTATESCEERLHTLSEITVDLKRTFPMLSFFNEGGPQHEVLRTILEAYALYRPDIGYVQGMSYIAAVLLLYLDTVDAFICMCNLLNRECHRAFYRMDIPLIERYYETFHCLLKEFLPKVETHLMGLGIRPEMYLLDWILTVYAKSLSLDIVSRIWDLYILEGDYFLFRVGLGLLRFFKKHILGSNMETCLKVLTKHNDEEIEEEDLFASIQHIDLTPTKFEAVFTLTARIPKSTTVNKI